MNKRDIVRAYTSRREVLHEIQDRRSRSSRESKTPRPGFQVTDKTSPGRPPIFVQLRGVTPTSRAINSSSTNLINEEDLKYQSVCNIYISQNEIKKKKKKLFLKY